VKKKVLAGHGTKGLFKEKDRLPRSAIREKTLGQGGEKNQPCEGTSEKTTVAGSKKSTYDNQGDPKSLTEGQKKEVDRKRSEKSKFLAGA